MQFSNQKNYLPDERGTNITTLLLIIGNAKQFLPPFCSGGKQEEMEKMKLFWSIPSHLSNPAGSENFATTFQLQIQHKVIAGQDSFLLANTSLGILAFQLQSIFTESSRRQLNCSAPNPKLNYCGQAVLLLQIIEFERIADIIKQ